MEYKLFVCASAHDFGVGGISTYHVRMFSWAQNNGYRCVLLLRKDRKVDEIWKVKLKKLNVDVEYYDLFFSQITKTNHNYNSLDEIVFLTADIHCFFRLKQIEKRVHKSKCKVLFYILHPHASRICENKLINLPYKKWFLSQLTSGVIFMDEETTISCERYYKIDLHPYKYFRLGEYIPKKNNNLIQSRIQTRKKEFRILTISRLDFPFKGYVLGLVDTFGRLALRYPNLYLDIIGDGPDQEQLRKKIKSLPLCTKNKITYVKKVSYDRLAEYFSSAHVFIGMGTTLLDASGYALPSIVATAFQNNDLCVGLFSEEYNNLGGNLELSKHKGTTFENAIEQILKMTDMAYLKAEEDTYNTVLAHYDINSIMPEIVNIPVNTVVYKESLMLVLYDCLIIILKKLLHFVQRRK